MLRRLFPILILSLGALLQISPAPLYALELGSSGFTPVSVPIGIEPVPQVNQADLDLDGHPETFALKAGRLSIVSASETVWQSPPGWEIVQAAITDLDNDGRPEIALLLWRSYQPWPVDRWQPNGGRIAAFQDAAGQSCHFILIGWRSQMYGELWAGSGMADPITSFAAADLDGDNAQELVALEGRYADSRSAPARTIKAWEWNGFGFTVVSSMDGKFEKLTLVRTNNDRVLILIP
jgi:hypothetical protein